MKAPFDDVDVQLLLRDGNSKAEIARKLDVTYETIRRHINGRTIQGSDSSQFVKWVGIQVERKNIHLVDGQIKVDQIIDLLKENTPLAMYSRDCNTNPMYNQTRAKVRIDFPLSAYLEARYRKLMASAAEGRKPKTEAQCIRRLERAGLETGYF